MLLGQGRQKEGKRRRPGRPRCRPRSRSAPAEINFAKSTVKRKQWSCASMSKAIEAVRQGSSVLRAAITHGVPRQSLHDRITGRVTHGSKPGPKPYLSKAEEESLADFLVETAKVGYGKSRQQVLLIDDHDYHNNNDNYNR